MPEANDQQMQSYAARVRARAQQFRAIYLACLDDKRAIKDVYDRCQNKADWVDARTDGPPHLLECSDMLVYDTMIYIFTRIVEGTATLDEIATFHANWDTFQKACVHAVLE